MLPDADRPFSKNKRFPAWAAALRARGGGAAGPSGDAESGAQQGRGSPGSSPLEHAARASATRRATALRFHVATGEVMRTPWWRSEDYRLKSNMSNRSVSAGMF